jgi:hypothetical protein
MLNCDMQMGATAIIEKDVRVGTLTQYKFLIILVQHVTAKGRGDIKVLAETKGIALCLEQWPRDVDVLAATEAKTGLSNTTDECMYKYIHVCIVPLSIMHTCSGINVLLRIVELAVMRRAQHCISLSFTFISINRSRLCVIADATVPWQ